MIRERPGPRLPRAPGAPRQPSPAGEVLPDTTAIDCDESAGHAPMALFWRVSERDGRVEVVIGGELDENTDFSELRRRLRGQVIFDLTDVRRMLGPRRYLALLRDVVR